MSIPLEKIVAGALLRRGTRYRLVCEVWDMETNDKMRAARGEMRRVGLHPGSGRSAIRVQYLPVDARCTPLKKNEHGRAVGWRWADMNTVRSWAKSVVPETSDKSEMQKGLTEAFRNKVWP